MDNVDIYLSTLKERFSQIDPKKYYFEDSYRVLDIDIEDMRKRRERRKAKRNNG